jgi:hypothetical protein
MDQSHRLLYASALLVAAFVVAGLVLLARSDPSIGDDITARATAAARLAVAGGRVTEVERSESAGATWEVDVISPDGTPLDVQLDDMFNLVHIEREVDDGPDGHDTGTGAGTHVD